jgi:uncharacterized protein
MSNVALFARELLAHPEVVAVLHAPPLPGSARARLALPAIVDHVLADAKAAAAGGAGVLLLENYGDAPFSGGPVGPQVIASMTRIALAVRGAVDLPLGVNVLRNDARAALAVAQAAGGAFVRVNVLAGVVATDQGLLTGEAEAVHAYRGRIGGTAIAILADVDVKHGVPLWGSGIGARAEDLATRALADGLIVTGEATGAAPALADLAEVRAACPSVPLLAGSGITAENARELLRGTQGVIVGTAAKRGGEIGEAIDRERLAAIVAAARAAWA